LLDGPSFLSQPGLKSRDWPAFAPINP